MAWEDLTEEKKGYIAGFIDADGSICISKQVVEGNEYYRPSISIYNNDKELLEWIASNLSDDGVEYSVDRRRDDRHNQDTYVIHIRKIEYLRDLLRNVSQYLRIKQKQADKALELISLIQNRDTKKYTEELLNELETKYNDVRVLNS